MIKIVKDTLMVMVYQEWQIWESQLWIMTFLSL